MLKQRNKTLKA